MHIRENSLDDLLHTSIEHILEDGEPISPSKGWAIELFGVLLELTNPRARISRTYTKGRLFSSLGELLWYLAGNNKVEFIEYYIPKYGRYSDDGETIYGAYGPRLSSQIERVQVRLRDHVDTRKAVIQLFDAKDIEQEHNDVPCTCTLQFALRNGRLHLHVNMRSNDILVGLPHDVFAFTMLQEIVASELGVELGTYKHSVGSLHLYSSDLSAARQYLQEAWQDRVDNEMPAMPRQSPWAAIKRLLEAEADIRLGRGFDHSTLALPDYWLDVIRLLKMYRLSKVDQNEVVAPRGSLMEFLEKVLKVLGLPNLVQNGVTARRSRLRAIAVLKREMSCRVFDQYIHKREEQIFAGAAGR